MDAIEEKDALGNVEDAETPLVAEHEADEDESGEEDEEGVGIQFLSDEIKYATGLLKIIICSSM